MAGFGPDRFRVMLVAGHVGTAGLGQSVQTNAAKRYRPVKDQHQCDQGLTQDPSHREVPGCFGAKKQERQCGRSAMDLIVESADRLVNRSRELSCPPGRGIGLVVPSKQSRAVPLNQAINPSLISTSSANTSIQTDQNPRPIAVCKMLRLICGVGFASRSWRASNATPHASCRFRHRRSRLLYLGWPGARSRPVSSRVRSALGRRVCSSSAVTFGG